MTTIQNFRHQSKYWRYIQFSFGVLSFYTFSISFTDAIFFNLVLKWSSVISFEKYFFLTQCVLHPKNQYGSL